MITSLVFQRNIVVFATSGGSMVHLFSIPFGNITAFICVNINLTNQGMVNNSKNLYPSFFLIKEKTNE